jgi:predicted DNA binding protein
MPRHSIKASSIAGALNISATTAEAWIREIEEQVKSIIGVTS